VRAQVWEERLLVGARVPMPRTPSLEETRPMGLLHNYELAAVIDKCILLPPIPDNGCCFEDWIHTFK
jgi:hypothetical protein